MTRIILKDEDGKQTEFDSKVNQTNSLVILIGGVLSKLLAHLNNHLIRKVAF